MTPPPRTRVQRKQDALNRLEHVVDAWVATADGGSGTPATDSGSFPDCEGHALPSIVW